MIKIFITINSTILKSDKWEMHMKTDILQEYGIAKSDVVFIETIKGTRACLCARVPLSANDEIAFKVFGKYFEDFFALEADNWFQEVQNRAIMAGFANAGDISDIAKEVIMSAFEAYLQEKDIEIVCDIEREKSPFYANKYNDFGVHKLAS